MYLLQSAPIFILTEERFLKQKAKIQWLKEGDSNSSYFHKVVKSHVSRNRIDVVTSSDDNLYKTCLKDQDAWRCANQSAFVPGRSITDNILLTQELMHNYHLNRDTPRYCSNLELVTLCFTDDLFLFTYGDVASASVIMEALDEFKDASGLIPNNYDNESSDADNNDDDVDKDEEDGEEEEHLAPVDPPTAGITKFVATLPLSSPPPENVESLKDNETMTTVDQGMSVEEIKRVVAQRVANAIEAIAIYETKTNIARKSISQTEQQECKLAENANNKRKWEGKHNGQCTVKGGNCKKCGSLRHFQDKCPNIEDFRNCGHKDQCGKFNLGSLFPNARLRTDEVNNTSKDNQNQQQPNKRQNTGKAYAAGHGDKKYYGGSQAVRPTNDNTNNNQRGTGQVKRLIAIMWESRHYKRDCPERKNQSHKNQIGGTGAHGVVHTLREGETDQDPHNIKDEIKA
ncbi:hypothetical protein Tco_0798547 [Tanacetum coccineum]